MINPSPIPFQPVKKSLSPLLNLNLENPCSLVQSINPNSTTNAQQSIIVPFHLKKGPHNLNNTSSGNANNINMNSQIKSQIQSCSNYISSSSSKFFKSSQSVSNKIKPTFNQSQQFKIQQEQQSIINSVKSQLKQGESYHKNIERIKVPFQESQGRLNQLQVIAQPPHPQMQQDSKNKLLFPQHCSLTHSSDPVGLAQQNYQQTNENIKLLIPTPLSSNQKIRSNSQLSNKNNVLSQLNTNQNEQFLEIQNVISQNNIKLRSVSSYQFPEPLISPIYQPIFENSSKKIDIIIEDKVNQSDIASQKQFINSSPTKTKNNIQPLQIQLKQKQSQIDFLQTHVSSLESKLTSQEEKFLHQSNILSASQSNNVEMHKESQLQISSLQNENQKLLSQVQSLSKNISHQNSSNILSQDNDLESRCQFLEKMIEQMNQDNLKVLKQTDHQIHFLSAENIKLSEALQVKIFTQPLTSESSSFSEEPMEKANLLIQDNERLSNLIEQLQDTLKAEQFKLRNTQFKLEQTTDQMKQNESLIIILKEEILEKEKCYEINLKEWEQKEIFHIKNVSEMKELLQEQKQKEEYYMRNENDKNQLVKEFEQKETQYIENIKEMKALMMEFEPKETEHQRNANEMNCLLIKFQQNEQQYSKNANEMSQLLEEQNYSIGKYEQELRELRQQKQQKEEEFRIERENMQIQKEKEIQVAKMQFEDQNMNIQSLMIKDKEGLQREVEMIKTENTSQAKQMINIQEKVNALISENEELGKNILKQRNYIQQLISENEELSNSVLQQKQIIVQLEQIKIEREYQERKQVELLKSSNISVEEEFASLKEKCNQDISLLHDEIILKNQIIIEEKEKQKASTEKIIFFNQTINEQEEQIKQYLQNNNELRQLNSNLQLALSNLKDQIPELNKMLKDMNDQNLDLSQQLVQNKYKIELQNALLNNQNNELQEVLALLEQKRSECSLIDQIQKNNQRFEQDINEFEEKIIQLNNQKQELADSNRELIKNNKELESNNQKLQILNIQLKSCQANQQTVEIFDDINNKKMDMKQKMSEYQREQIKFDKNNNSPHQGRDEKCNSYLQSKEENNEEIISLQVENTNLNLKVQVLQEENEKLILNREILLKEREEIIKEGEQLTDNLQKTKDENSSLIDLIQQTKEELDGSIQLYKQLILENSQLRDKSEVLSKEKEENAILKKRQAIELSKKSKELVEKQEELDHLQLKLEQSFTSTHHNQIISAFPHKVVYNSILAQQNQQMQQQQKLKLQQNNKCFSSNNNHSIHNNSTNMKKLSQNDDETKY